MIHNNRLCAISTNIALIVLLTGCNTLHPASPVAAPTIAATSAPPIRQKLALEGAHNVRNLGGYRTTDGRITKSGVLFRSDNLAHLTTADLESLGSLHLNQVVDFRSSSEKQREPDRLPENNSIRAIAMPVDFSAGTLQAMQGDFFSGKGNADAGEILIETNRALVRDNTPLFREFIQRVANSNNLPLLFHCTSGKDRAGFATAITLLALGVPKETVMADYMLSNTYLAEASDARLAGLAKRLNRPIESLRPMMAVERRYLETAFEQMKIEYGSVDNYLREGLGIDAELRTRLRNTLLEP